MGRAATPAFSNPRMSLKVGAFPTQMSLKGRGAGASEEVLLIHERGAEAREAGERRKPTVPPCGMGKVRSKRNKPAKRARNLAAFSVAPFAGSGVSTFGAALGRWHRGAVPRIIAGGEGRWFSGPNPRIKAKEKCAATAAREGAASVILRGPAGARSMVLLVPGVAGRKNGGPHPRLGFSAPLRGAKCRNSSARSAVFAPPSAARWPRIWVPAASFRLLNWLV